ncbi:MAG TPA: hypothetical protein VFB32_04840 [Rudaea sp.]|jgi:toxin CptA|nr:hypothetical protein [Rudaea sp.]
MKSARAIAFEYRPSRVLAGIVAAASVAALCAAAASGMPTSAKMFVCTLGGIYAIFALRRFLRPRFVRAQWRSDGPWRLVDTQDRIEPADLHEAVALGPLIVLDLALARRRRFRVVLLPDNAPFELRRRLRVRLAGNFVPKPADSGEGT